MPKTAKQRTDKYYAKYDPAVIQLRYTATKEAANEAQIAIQGLLADKNAAVRGILNALGIYPILTVQYQAFSNRLFGICNRLASLTAPTHSVSATATAEALGDLAKWNKMGADKAALTSIWNLYADMLGACPSPLPTIS